MSKINDAIVALHEIDLVSAKKRISSKIHPLAILLVTICYMLICVSFEKYELKKLSSMVVYLIAVSILEELSFQKGFRFLKYVFTFVFLLGLVNPFLDQRELFYIGKLPVTGGFVSMFSLWTKSIFCMYAVYFMILQIGIEGVCFALQTLHVPSAFVTVILLIYRYIIVFMREIERMWTAYHMRAPGQKGVKLTDAGSFVGNLLLRSLDRGDRLYESMLLRGYDAKKGIVRQSKKYSIAGSVCFAFIWGTIFVCCKCLPVFDLIGQLFV